MIFRTWASSLAALGIIWGYVVLRDGGRLFLRSDVIVLVSLSVQNLIPPLYLSVRLPSQPGVDPYSVSDMYALVSLVTTIGVLALLIGYRAVERRFHCLVKRKAFGPGASESKLLPIIIPLAGVTWLARFYLLAKGAYYWVYVNPDFVFGRWFSVVFLIARLGLIVPILLWLLAGKNPRWRFWAWVATGAELAYVVPTGARNLIVKTLGGLLLVFWWRNRRLPWRWIGVFVLVGLFTMPVLGQYRYTIGQFTAINRFSITSSVAAFQLAKERYEASFGGSYIDFVDSSMERLYDGQHLGYLLKHYRESYDWEYGRTYYTRVPFLVLPYFIFPNRPIMQVPIDIWFKLVAGGSSPATFLGEAYINFWYVGIIIIPFLMGIILASYDAFFIRRKDDPLTAAVYLLFATYFLFIGNANLAVWLGVMRDAVLLTLLLYLGRRVLALL